jgi:hypothetical protein
MIGKHKKDYDLISKKLGGAKGKQMIFSLGKILARYPARSLGFSLPNTERL